MPLGGGGARRRPGANGLMRPAGMNSIALLCALLLGGPAAAADNPFAVHAAGQEDLGELGPLRAGMRVIFECAHLRADPEERLRLLDSLYPRAAAAATDITGSLVSSCDQEGGHR